MVRLLAAAVVCAALAAGCGAGTTTPPRPGLERTLDSLVTGPFHAAPGASAYVAGPHGAWSGASGMADLATHAAMTPDTRSRLGSVSKLWTATVVVELAEEGKLRLDDSVERWLPGRFPDGRRMTIRQLLSHTSGMIDDNDISARPLYYFDQIDDPALIRAAVDAAAANRMTPQLEVRVAAALPLVAPPGTAYHYSNIGFKAAGLIAEKASGESLDHLYRRIIVDPLHLASYGYDPTPAIPGAHATGYVVERNGKARPDPGAGAWEASGGIVTDARDEARFLVALAQGKILSRPYLRQVETPGLQAYGLGTGVGTLCGSRVLTHGGATQSYRAEVVVSVDGRRVAVLLANGRASDPSVDSALVVAVDNLFCAA